MHQILLQYATAILLQNAPEFLSQNATVYYKMQQILQNLRMLLQNATVITKCDVYYKCFSTVFLKIL